RRYVSLCPSTKADAKSRIDECRKCLPSSRASVIPPVTGWADKFQPNRQELCRFRVANAVQGQPPAQSRKHIFDD
ncbi:hypothetical protein CH063_06815, partial [Colletotrichum higginsianum]